MNDAQFDVWNMVNDNFKVFTDAVVINNRVQCLADLSARNHNTMLAATKAFRDNDCRGAGGSWPKCKLRH